MLGEAIKLTGNTKDSPSGSPHPVQQGVKSKTCKLADHTPNRLSFSGSTFPSLGNNRPEYPQLSIIQTVPSDGKKGREKAVNQISTVFVSQGTPSLFSLWRSRLWNTTFHLLQRTNGPNFMSYVCYLVTSAQLREQTWNLLPAIDTAEDGDTAMRLFFFGLKNQCPFTFTGPDMKVKPSTASLRRCSIDPNHRNDTYILLSYWLLLFN